MWGLRATTYLCPLLKHQLGRTNPHCYIQQPLLYSRIPPSVSSSTVTPSWRCRALSCPRNYWPQDSETVVLLRQPPDLSNQIIISFACVYVVREGDSGPAKKVRLLQFRVLQFWQVSPTTCSHCLLTQQPACCYKNPSPGWCACRIHAHSSFWVGSANPGWYRAELQAHSKHRVLEVCAPLNTVPEGPERVHDTLNSGFTFCFVNKTTVVSSCWTARWGACPPATLTAPTLRWLRPSQDCLLLPTLPVLSLLQCLVQSRCLGPLHGFYNRSFSITCIILPGLV